MTRPPKRLIFRSGRAAGRCDPGPAMLTLTAGDVCVQRADARGGVPPVAESPQHPLQAGVVVGMSVGQDNSPEVSGADLEHVHVVHRGVADSGLHRAAVAPGVTRIERVRRCSGSILEQVRKIIVDFIRHAVELIAQPEVQRQVLPDFPAVLHVNIIFMLAKTAHIARRSVAALIEELALLLRVHHA